MSGRIRARPHSKTATAPSTEPHLLLARRRSTVRAALAALAAQE